MNDKLLYKYKASCLLNDLHNLTSKVVEQLFEYIDDMNISLELNEDKIKEYMFSNMLFALKKCLNSEELSYVALDVISGFTLIVTKKSNIDELDSIGKTMNNPFIQNFSTQERNNMSQEFKVSLLLLNNFFERTSEKAIIFETMDVIILLLPSIGISSKIRSFIKEFDKNFDNITE